MAEKEEKARTSTVADPDADVIVCRCEEVSRKEIRDAIEFGAEDLNDVKRMTRAGMGLCQGRTCRRLVAQIFSEETGTPASEVEPWTFRPPVRPLRVETLSDVFSVVEEMHAESDGKPKAKCTVAKEDAAQS